jgi:hypothetical protein
MEMHPDFRELLGLFATHSVDYAIVGGYALAFHGAPRYTGDLDILVAPEQVNAERILTALEEFGFGEANLAAADFVDPSRFVRLGHPPVRVDILTSISGLTWHEVRANRVKGMYGDVSVYFIGRGDFVANKRAAGRTKDIADIEALGEQ